MTCEVAVAVNVVSKVDQSWPAGTRAKDPTTRSLFKRLAKETGIYEWERYIDASSHPNWEEDAMKWIVSGGIITPANLKTNKS